jgi:hypothetical protein
MTDCGDKFFDNFHGQSVKDGGTLAYYGGFLVYGLLIDHDKIITSLKRGMVRN